MKKVLSTEARPIFMWLEDVEESALQQAKNLANLPFIFRHVALMPDCHAGYGMPIGGVLATKGIVIPNAVGVDIGCGMCAVNTSIKIADINKSDLLEIVEQIKKVIPVGFAHQEEPESSELMPRIDPLLKRNYKPIVLKEFDAALRQLGTLGGGNHFIEIQQDLKGYLWVMIHSGSRNLGKKVADYYNQVAVNLNEKWYSSVPKSEQLAFLPIDTLEGKHYMMEMSYCVEFALANRLLMMQRVKSCIETVLGKTVFGEIINIAHNYAQFEHHFGENVIVHRKGATSAKYGETGIIPGSQGTKSYIVKGKGNQDSFHSCSHGAGRRMGRKEAQRVLDLQEEINAMDEKGIIHGIRSVSDLDEAASAYKDIDTVMANQTDLVEIIVELTPLAVVKG